LVKKFKKMSEFLPSDDLSKDRSHSPKQAEGTDFISLIRKWKVVVGEHMAKNTMPLRIRSQSLYIAVKNASYSHQLSFLESTIIDKIKLHSPAVGRKFKNIKFVTTTAPFELLKKKEEVTSKEKLTFHKYDPQFRQAKKDFKEKVQDFEDEDLLDLLASISMQASEKNDGRPT
jgi:hypothetical protein